MCSTGISHGVFGKPLFSYKCFEVRIKVCEEKKRGIFHCINLSFSIGCTSQLPLESDIEVTGQLIFFLF